MVTEDDLGRKVNLILENLKLLEEVQQQQTSIQELQEKNKKLQQEKEDLEGLTKKIMGSSTFPALLRQYELFMMEKKVQEFYAGNLSEFKSLTANITQVFTPPEIDNFLQLTRQYAQHKNYHGTVGIFTSKLIQNSYDKGGHTQFTLTTEKHPKRIDYLGVYLNGWKEEAINITIKGKDGNAGDYGSYLGFRANNVKIYCASNTSSEPLDNSTGNFVGFLILAGIANGIAYGIYQLMK